MLKINYNNHKSFLIIIMFIFHWNFVSINECHSQDVDTCIIDRGNRMEGVACEEEHMIPIFFLRNVSYIWNEKKNGGECEETKNNIVIEFYPIPKKVTKAKLYIYEPPKKYIMQTKNGTLLPGQAKFSWPNNVLTKLKIKLPDLVGYLRFNDFISTSSYVLSPVCFGEKLSLNKPIGFKVTLFTLVRMYVSWKISYSEGYEWQKSEGDTLLSQEKSQLFLSKEPIPIKFPPEKKEEFKKGSYFIELTRKKVDIISGNQTQLPKWLVKIVVI